MLKIFGIKRKEVNRSKYDIDGVPLLREAIPLGLQHIFAMFASNIAVPIIIAGVVGITGEDLTILVQSAMIVAGIATIIQCYPIGRVGGKLPIVMGSSFGFLPTNISIAQNFGIAGLLGANFIGGLFCTLLGFFLKPLRKFFPSIVTGTVVLIIGISLFPTGIEMIAGGSGSPNFGYLVNWLVGVGVMCIVLALNKFATGFAKTSSVLIGIIIGYLVSIPLGIVDFTPVKEAAWFSIPRPMHFPLQFHLGAIIPMMIMFIVTTVETVGHVSAITMGGDDREPTDTEVSGAIISNGLGSAFAAVFNALPNTSFSQNVGMISFTKIMSRFVVALGAVFLILAGLIPKIGSMMCTIPQPVIGGASLVVFSQMTLTAFSILTSQPLTEKAKMTIGISLALGLGLSQVPTAMEYFPEALQLILGGSGIVIACLVAIILNIIIPEDEKSEQKELKSYN